MKFVLRSFTLAAIAMLGMSTCSFADIFVDYSSTAPFTQAFADGSGNVAFTANSGTGVDASLLPNGGTISFSTITVSTATTGAAFTGTYSFNVTVTYNGASQVIVASGTDSGNAGSFHANSPILNPVFFTLSGILFEAFLAQASDPQLAAPSHTGSLSFHILSVPEPASVALLGMGSVGAFGLFRRMKARVNA